STFEFMDEGELTVFTDAIRDQGLESALAGTLKFGDLPMLRRIRPDIIGVRGMVCGGDRTSVIREELVSRLKSEM
ncbi:MAG: (5-formylfuran-3-yl)methyl phosphate synthase, partial [Methanolobus sp.]|nr:(5-formylfuran-3-yl)methyl phosphate synthase [Methanolobus sp.]